MAVPELIPIRREADYRTDTIGTCAGGQFFASVTGAFRGSPGVGPPGNDSMRWYSVLHLFDGDGRHLHSDIWFAGTTAGGQQEAVQRGEQHLRALLDGLAARSYADIAVRLFRVDHDGVVFGLIDESEPERGDRVELHPDGLGFPPPWNGLYDT